MGFEENLLIYIFRGKKKCFLVEFVFYLGLKQCMDTHSSSVLSCWALFAKMGLWNVTLTGQNRHQCLRMRGLFSFLTRSTISPLLKRLEQDQGPLVWNSIYTTYNIRNIDTHEFSTFFICWQQYIIKRRCFQKSLCGHALKFYRVNVLKKIGRIL